MREIYGCFFFAALWGTLLAQETPPKESPEVLFKQLYGSDLESVQKTPSKKDDAELGKKIIEDVKALGSNPALQQYAKIKALELLVENKESQDLALKVFSETKETLLPSDKAALIPKIFALQKDVVSSLSPTKDKDKLPGETEKLSSLAEEICSSALQKDDFKGAIDVLKVSESAFKKFDKDQAGEIGKRIAKLEDQYKRFKKVEIALQKLEKDPGDAKANQDAAQYYLLEKGNLYKAWPYLEKSGDPDLGSFVKLIEDGLLEGQPRTEDGLSLVRLPIALEHPKYFLDWLKEKDFPDWATFIIGWQEGLDAGKALYPEAIKKAIEEKIKSDGKPVSLPSEKYKELAKCFEALLGKLSEMKGLEESLFKKRQADLTLNKFIALGKAKLQAEKEGGGDEAQKIKLDLEISKTTEVLKILGENPSPVTLETPFRFSATSLAGDGDTYTFDDTDWERFKREWDISNILSYKEEIRTKCFLKPVDGKLRFYAGSASVQFVSKKKKWQANTEISFDLWKPQYETIFINFPLEDLAADKMWYRPDRIQCYFYVIDGGWFGLYGKDNQENAVPEKAASIPSGKKVFGDKEKIRVRIIKEGGRFRLLLGELEAVNTDASSVPFFKNVDGKSIRITIQHPWDKDPKPTEIDNLYVGTPKPIKEKK